MLLFQKAFGGQIDELLLLFAVVVSIYFYGLIWWNIFNKAGYRPTNSLLMYIPFVNLVLLAMLAFKEWPFTNNAYMRALRSAIWHERKGNLDEAIEEYQKGIDGLKMHIDRLKEMNIAEDEQHAHVRML
jgi:hypothetical protein